MKPQDSERFAEVMTTLAIVFDKELSNAKLDIYFEFLKVYDINLVELAAKHIMANRMITGTFPLISEFVQAIEYNGRTLDEFAELAWRTFNNTVHSISLLDKVYFEDGAITEVIKTLGGWANMENQNVDETVFRRQFLNLYTGFVKQKPKSEILNPTKRLVNWQYAPVQVIGYDGTVNKGGLTDEEFKQLHGDIKDIELYKSLKNKHRKGIQEYLAKIGVVDYARKMIDTDNPPSKLTREA